MGTGRWLRDHSVVRSPVVSGHVMLVSGVLLWGSLGLSGAQVANSTGLSSAAISGLRLLLGAVVLLTVATLAGELRRLRWSKAVAVRVAMTSCGTAVYATSYLEAITHVGVAVATAVTLGVAPIFVLLGSATVQRRRPSAVAVQGTVVAIIGLVLVCGPMRESSVPDATGHILVGILLSVAGALTFGVTTLVNRVPSAEIGTTTLLALSFVGSGVLSLLVALPQGVNGSHLGGRGLFWLVFMAVVPTVIGYLAYFSGLQRGVPASSALVLTTLEVVSAAALAMVFLGERVGPVAAGGMALIMLSAVLLRPPRALLP